jgi:LuxR family transcriptional activator of bioluminescence operon
VSIDLEGLDHCVYLCDQAVSPESIPTILDQFTSKIGFDRYLLRTNLRSRSGPSRKLRVTNYEQTWLSHYYESNYGMVDPAVSHARDQAGAACLHGLLCESGSRKLKQFNADVRDAKLDRGITVPLRTSHLAGVLNLHNSEKAPSFHEIKHYVVVFAASLSDMLTRVLLPIDQRLEYDKLTFRERQVLFWTTAGKTAWETSVILGISERTVVAHLANSTEALGCSNRSQLLGRISVLLDSDPALNNFRLEL